MVHIKFSVIFRVILATFIIAPVLALPSPVDKSPLPEPPPPPRPRPPPPPRPVKPVRRLWVYLQCFESIIHTGLLVSMLSEPQLLVTRIYILLLLLLLLQSNLLATIPPFLPILLVDLLHHQHFHPMWNRGDIFQMIIFLTSYSWIFTGLKKVIQRNDIGNPKRPKLFKVRVRVIHRKKDEK